MSSPLPSPSPPVLYSTRDLSLLFLSPAFHSPCLLTCPLSSELRWFWRCDLTFLSWLLGVAAKSRGQLSPSDRQACDTILALTCAEYGITDDGPIRLPAPGAKLDESFLLESLDLYDSHLCPEWRGMHALATKHELNLSTRLREILV